MHELFHLSPAYRDLQPLRVPAGWTIGWNTLCTSARAEQGDFGGSCLFNATHPARRFNIDVAFEPEFDPAGAFHLVVLYQPWSRTEKGRRRSEEPFRLDAQAETVHAFTTRSYAELIAELEQWIARCSVWTREGN